MSGAALALVLSAAVLHSGWNALSKRGQNPLCFLWSAGTLATVLCLPLGVRALLADGFPASALPYVFATIVLHAVYFYALGRSYRSGEFSLVYPIARGFGVALVPIFALLLLDERLSPLGSTGVALVVVGIVCLQLTSRGWTGMVAQLSHVGPGTWWALFTGVMTASYSLVDKAGVAHLHPVPYIALMFLGMNLLLLPVIMADSTALRREWAANWRTILIASVLTVTAYLLVLFAFRLSKAGYVVAAREVSIVLSALIGSLWLKEGRLGPRLAGAVVVLAGVACVALAR